MSNLIFAEDIVVRYVLIYPVTRIVIHMKSSSGIDNQIMPDIDYHAKVIGTSTLTPRLQCTVYVTPKVDAPNSCPDGMS